MGFSKLSLHRYNTAMPLLRFDARQPKKWFHKFQHWYLFLAFPLMQVAFQVGDITGLVTRDCEGAKLHGGAVKAESS